MQATIRSAGIEAFSVPSGSRLSSRRPSWGPPWHSKYHQGMPFCTGTITASGRHRPSSSPATAAI